jgi:catechol 2,3-dioxygenase-like lactoylglutathione lyase family enzyme
MLTKRGPETTRLEWVEARVSDYEDTSKSYRETPGLPLNFEEERKDFIRFRVDSSKTYLALNVDKTAMAKAGGFVLTFKVLDLRQFIDAMERKGVRVRGYSLPLLRSTVR